MENDYRITKLHGTLIGDNRIPDLPADEKTKVFSSTNGKTAWVDLPTDVGKDASGFAVLCHDGVEITGQRKTVKLADVRENGAIIGRDQTTSAPQVDELITKAYGDKAYEGKIEVINATVADESIVLSKVPTSNYYILNADIMSSTSNSYVLMTMLSGSGETATYVGITSDGDSLYVVATSGKDGFVSRNRFLPEYSSAENGKFLSVVNGDTSWSDIPDGGKELELIEVSNATINPDGSYTYTLPNKPTSNPYILKTVDSGESAYYLMTGDSDVSFGMRPLALTDSLFGGNFMVVSGTTATQRPTNFPPQPKSADNGKVLTVNNGYPSWETAGGATPVVETTLHDDSITLPEAQTTNFIIHNETLGYMYVNNIDGAYSAIIPVGKDNSGNNQLALFSGEGTNLTLEVVTLGGGISSGVINSLQFPKVINSEEGYNLLSPIIDTGEIVYAGNAVTDNSGMFRLMLGLSSNVVPTAEGEQEYCNFDCIVKDMGIGRMSLKKDANNIPQFKSFTTWLPPVTSASEGKALIVTGGNAQWGDLPTTHQHTVVIKEGSKIIFAANKDLASATPATTLETLISTFKDTTTAGFGDYILLTVDTAAKLTKQDGTETDLSTLTVTISDTVK